MSGRQNGHLRKVTLRRKNAAGSVTEYESPKWYGCYRDGRGRWRQTALSTDRRESERRLKKLVRDAEFESSGSGMAFGHQARRPVSDHLREWQELLESEERSPDHIERHTFRARTVLEEAGVRRITEINADEVKRAVGRLKRSKNWSDGTAAHYIAATKSFARWLWTSGRLPASPLVGVRVSRGQPRKRRRPLSHSDLARLLATTKASVRVRKGRKHRWRFAGDDRYRLYLLAARTGLRASELAALKPSDFDFDASTVRAKVCTGNKGKREMLIPLPTEVTNELRPWVESLSPVDFLWPGPWASNRHAGDFLRADLKEAGIPFSTDDGDFDFHALRGQYATDLVREGANPAIAKRLMRHSTVTLTMNYYARAEAGELRETVNRIASVA